MGCAGSTVSMGASACCAAAGPGIFHNSTTAGRTGKSGSQRTSTATGGRCLGLNTFSGGGSTCCTALLGNHRRGRVRLFLIGLRCVSLFGNLKLRLDGFESGEHRLGHSLRFKRGARGGLSLAQRRSGFRSLHFAIGRRLGIAGSYAGGGLRGAVAHSAGCLVCGGTIDDRHSPAVLMCFEPPVHFLFPGWCGGGLAHQCTQFSSSLLTRFLSRSSGWNRCSGALLRLGRCALQEEPGK